VGEEGEICQISWLSSSVWMIYLVLGQSVAKIELAKTIRFSDRL
jgi:hypothetical protein